MADRISPQVLVRRMRRQLAVQRSSNRELREAIRVANFALLEALDGTRVANGRIRSALRRVATL